MGALVGSCAAATGGGRAVSVPASALAAPDGAGPTGPGWFATAKANVGAAPATGKGERACGAAQPINPDEGGAPPTISAVAANTHG